MKKMKNLLALLLAVVTVISGIYFVQADGSEAKAETATNTKSATIVSDMLNVKVQPGKTADGSLKALRFVSSVNSLDYKEAGFEVMDKIVISYQADEKVSGIFEKYGEEIKADVLGLEIVSGQVSGYTKEWNINGENVHLGVERK